MHKTKKWKWLMFALWLYSLVLLVVLMYILLSTPPSYLQYQPSKNDSLSALIYLPIITYLVLIGYQNFRSKR